MDLTGCSRIAQVLRVLEDANINVLTGTFSCYESAANVTTFEAKFSDAFLLLKEFDNCSSDERFRAAAKILKLANSLHLLGTTAHDEVSLLGQRLTDFGNGELFKTMLSANGFDGYMWNEGNPIEVTYCLINSEKLSPPKVEAIMDSSCLIPL